jgi:predicted  nucleic acid-binding Zn-ribbon protein
MTQKTKLSIWERIAAKLELSDSDKLKSFFTREKKRSMRAIKTLEKNKEVLKMNYENDLSAYNDMMEDTRNEYELSKEEIVPENVTGNSAMDSFSAQYWTGIQLCKDKLESLEAQISDLKSDYDLEVEAIDKEIALYQERIDICDEKK